MPLMRAASTPSGVVLLPTTSYPRPISDSANGMPSQPKPIMATFFILFLS